MFQDKQNIYSIVFKGLRFNKINVSSASIKDYLISHPNYPSFKSICDGLNNWNVENYPLKLTSNEIKELNGSFFAHLKKDQIVFVKQINSHTVNYFTTNQLEKKEAINVFLEQVSGAVIVFEANENSGEKDFRLKRQNELLNIFLFYFVLTSVITLSIFAIYTNYKNILAGDSVVSYLILTKLIGLVSSIFLVLKELKIKNTFSDKICSFNLKTNCDKVLSTNASIVFGWIGWADVGLIYFLGTLIFLFATINTPSLWLLALFSLLVLPYTIFSVYYQAYRVKQWCPFCMVVQVVLVVEAIILFNNLWQVSFSIDYMFHFAFFMFLPATFWMLCKALVLKNKQYSKEHTALLEFKHNPKIFISLLEKEGFYIIKNSDNSLILGKKDAKIKITVFLSLYCNHCSSTFLELEKLVKENSSIHINAVFFINNDENYKKMINAIYFLYQTKGDKVVFKLLKEWYSLQEKNVDNLLIDIKVPNDFDVTSLIGKENETLFSENKIYGTPSVFLNGYRYPIQAYDYSYIKYFYKELENQIVECKGQEVNHIQI